MSYGKNGNPKHVVYKTSTYGDVRVQVYHMQGFYHMGATGNTLTKTKMVKQ